MLRLGIILVGLLLIVKAVMCCAGESKGRPGDSDAGQKDSVLRLHPHMFWVPTIGQL